MLRAWYEGWRYTHRAQDLKDIAMGLGVLFLVFLPFIMIGVLMLLSLWLAE